VTSVRGRTGRAARPGEAAGALQGPEDGLDPGSHAAHRDVGPPLSGGGTAATRVVGDHRHNTPRLQPGAQLARVIGRIGPDDGCRVLEIQDAPEPVPTDGRCVGSIETPDKAVGAVDVHMVLVAEDRPHQRFEVPPPIAIAPPLATPLQRPAGVAIHLAAARCAPVGGHLTPLHDLFLAFREPRPPRLDDRCVHDLPALGDVPSFPQVAIEPREQPLEGTRAHEPLAPFPNRPRIRHRIARGETEKPLEAQPIPDLERERLTPQARKAPAARRPRT